jgi:hypothetical protein
MLAGRLLLVLAISALILPGCSNSKLPPGAKPTKKVSVVVLYKGAPVEGAIVTFVNTDGPPPANGRTDAQGKAVMKTYLEGDGATLGTHKVMISKDEAVGGQSLSTDDPKYDPNAKPATIKHHLPEKYGNIATSGLTAEVKTDGPPEFTFDLKE